MNQQSMRAGRRAHTTATRFLSLTAAAAVAVAALVPANSALAAEAPSIATVLVSGELNPIDVKVVKATGALKNAIVDGVSDGLGRRGLYSLSGLTAPTSGIAEATYAASSVVGKQWKPKYGWGYDTVVATKPDKIELADGGLRIGSGTDRIERQSGGLLSSTTLQNVSVNLAELSDDAAAVLGLIGDDANILTASSIATTYDATNSGGPSISTAITGLSIFGETIELPGGELLAPVTRTESVATTDVVALLRGLGIDPADIDQYAPMVGSSNLEAELSVTAATSEFGGIDVEIGVELDLAAVSAGDEETPAGAHSSTSNCTLLIRSSMPVLAKCRLTTSQPESRPSLS